MAWQGSGPGPPPREVVARAKDGSAQARARLIEYYYQPLRAFLRQRIGNPESSDDVAQDTFVYALAHLDELTKDTSFRAWLYRIARSQAGQEWRRPERTRLVSLDAAADVPTPALREVLEGHGLRGESIPRLAQQAGRSVAAVKKNFTRAKDRFEELYAKEQEHEDEGDGEGRAAP